MAKKADDLASRRYRRIEGEVTPEDLAYARRQDRWACVVVRAIQRAFPEAIYVDVNKDRIRLSVEEDGPTGTRYEFEMPEGLVNDVIKPFDEGGTPAVNRKFVLDTALASWPMTKTSTKEKTARRARISPNQRSDARRRTGTSNPNVRTMGRFTEDAQIMAELAARNPEIAAALEAEMARRARRAGGSR